MINILKKIDSKDRSQKLVLELSDHRLVESVIMPRPYAGASSLCISVQVGCAVGCTFCKTGQMGLTRNLSSEEIIEQLNVAEKEKHIDFIVLMGMGDSAHNINNVLTAINEFVRRGKDKDRIFISSIGTDKFFDELESTIIKPRLAVSLHSAIDTTRKFIIPMANLMNVQELIERSQYYARLTHRRVMYQLTMLKGVNDTDEEISSIIDHLMPYKQYSMIQIIPWNYVSETNFISTEESKVNEIIDRFKNLDFDVRKRYSFGQDIGGACGQLSSDNYSK
jgi:23S rRNA (adenine2503-C2)-methyltransferase